MPPTSSAPTPAQVPGIFLAGPGPDLPSLCRAPFRRPARQAGERHRPAAAAAWTTPPPTTPRASSICLPSALRLSAEPARGRECVAICAESVAASEYLLAALGNKRPCRLQRLQRPLARVRSSNVGRSARGLVPTVRRFHRTIVAPDFEAGTPNPKSPLHPQPAAAAPAIQADRRGGSLSHDLRWHTPLSR